MSEQQYDQSGTPASTQPYYPQQTYNTEPQHTATHTVTPVPHQIITRLDGRNLSDRIVRHQFDLCCWFLPLHSGAMIIAFLMTAFYGYCGLFLCLSSTFRLPGYSVIFIIVGILYLLIAVISGYGFVGIYQEEGIWVDRFINFFVIGSGIWVVLEIIEVILTVALYAHYGGSMSWIAGWVVTFLIGLGFQYYFCCCLVSYQRSLHARNGTSAHVTVDKNIAMA